MNSNSNNIRNKSVQKRFIYMLNVCWVQAKARDFSQHHPSTPSTFYFPPYGKLCGFSWKQGGVKRESLLGGPWQWGKMVLNNFWDMPTAHSVTAKFNFVLVKTAHGAFYVLLNSFVEQNIFELQLTESYTYYK